MDVVPRYNPITKITPYFDFTCISLCNQTILRHQFFKAPQVQNCGLNHDIYERGANSDDMNLEDDLSLF